MTRTRSLVFTAALLLLGCATPKVTESHLTQLPPLGATNTLVVVMPDMVRIWPFSEFSLVKVVQVTVVLYKEPEREQRVETAGDARCADDRVLVGAGYDGVEPVDRCGCRGQ